MATSRYLLLDVLSAYNLSGFLSFITFSQSLFVSAWQQDVLDHGLTSYVTRFATDQRALVLA